MARDRLDQDSNVQLTVNWKKCEFGCSRVRCLGYLLDRDGLRPDMERANLTIPGPQDKKATTTLPRNGRLVLEIHRERK